MGPIIPSVHPHSPFPKQFRLRELLLKLHMRERYEVVLGRGERTVQAGGADLGDARLLDLPVGTPVLEFQRTSFAREQPAEFVISTYRGDRREFRVALDAPTPAHPQGGTVA